MELLECRRLFAATITYTLIELTFEPTDLNNLDQIAAADNVYQIRKGGRLEATALPTLVRNGRVVANRINDNGTLIGLETPGQPQGDALTLPQRGEAVAERVGNGARVRESHKRKGYADRPGAPGPADRRCPPAARAGGRRII